ncbi:MAG: translation initiation factor IF-2 [Chitinophagales bacterium]
MAGTNKGVRLSKAAREVNLGIDNVVAHLKKKGFIVQANPNTKITGEMYQVLLKDFQINIALKEKADGISFRNKKEEIAVKGNALTPVVLDDAKTKTEKTEKVVPVAEKSADKPPVIIEAEKKQPLKEKAVPMEKPKITTPTPSIKTPKLEQTQEKVKAIVEAKEEKVVEKKVKINLEKPVEQPIVKIEKPKAKVVEKTESAKPIVEKAVPKAKDKTPLVDTSKEKDQKLEKPKVEVVKKVEPIKAPIPIKETPKTIVEKKIEKTEITPKNIEKKPTIKKEIPPKKEATSSVTKEIKVLPKHSKITLETKKDNSTLPTTDNVLPAAENRKEKATNDNASISKTTNRKKVENNDKSNLSSNNKKKRRNNRNKKTSVSNETKTQNPIVSPTIEKVKTPKEDSKTTDKKTVVSAEKTTEVTPKKREIDMPKLTVVGKIDLDSLNLRTRPERRKRTSKKRRGGRTDDNAKNKSTSTSNTSNTNTKNTTGKISPAEEAKKKRRRRKRIPTTDSKVKLDTNNKTGSKEGDNRNKRNSSSSTGNNDRRTPRTRDNNSRSNSGSSSSSNSNNRNNTTRKRTGESPASIARSRRRSNNSSGRNRRNRLPEQAEVSEKEIQAKIKATMAKISGGSKGKNTRAKIRKQKRVDAADKQREAIEQKDHSLLQVTEFVSVNELAKLMEVPVTKVITTCFTLGIIVSINQRLDAEVIELVADEFGFNIDFISVTEQDDDFIEEEDAEEDLKPRASIVTIMGHVDHGKTSLLDYIRSASVVAGEVGGITQHIGAYEVTMADEKKITFLDTPGHEAFTAMRARGAKITDIAVIVIAADDSIMPQTKEAISHAQAADVPMVFAINKIDKPEAQPEKIKEQLAQMNILVEDWGGSYQCQEISAKKGINIDELLEKIVLEAEILELKANPDRKAVGTVIEASLDKGRGYVSTVLVQKGTLKVGDIILAGQYNGRVRAMFNERGGREKTAGPSQPVLILGLNGAPQAGDRLRVMDKEQEARELAIKRQQITREQQQRAHKHITLEEIGRRLLIGNFKELNLIIKGDFDGSVEALSDALLKLSTEEIQVRIIHRSVGAITESDVLLASASDAIIVGFQVRPTSNARKQGEKENIDIRLYSIIYDAIDEIKAAMEGMLEPKVEERFVCNIEVKEVFKISKVGTIAGCFVTEGKVYRDTKIRLIRDGVVKYTGDIATLRRYKDEVKEVLSGMECGIALNKYGDIKVGDVIEGYEEIEIKRTLSSTRK